MDTAYLDRHGMTWAIGISITYHNDGKVFLIHRNGSLFLELICNKGHWAELYSGGSDDAEEYGEMLDKIFFPPCQYYQV